MGVVGTPDQMGVLWVPKLLALGGFGRCNSFCSGEAWAVFRTIFLPWCNL